MLTETQLRQIMPNLAAAKAAALLPFLNDAMARYGIDSMLRTAAFAAQLAHESGEFRWMEEIWGPTAAQQRYEPPNDLAKRLGNTEPGDGKRYKGRGPIQITGRFNYRKYGELLGIDLVGQPEQAATPAVAFAVAALFWKSNRLNDLADSGDFVTLTRRINGGTNGLADRQKYHARAKDVLAEGFEPGPAAAATRGARRVPEELEPLARGYEEIRKPAAKKTPVARKRAATKAAPRRGA